jgi:hypothetical protein
MWFNLEWRPKWNPFMDHGNRVRRHESRILSAEAGVQSDFSDEGEPRTSDESVRIPAPDPTPSIPLSAEWIDFRAFSFAVQDSID